MDTMLHQGFYWNILKYRIATYKEYVELQQS